MDDVELLERARDVLERSYAPYSGYRVGAALETADGGHCDDGGGDDCDGGPADGGLVDGGPGTVFTGCNVENANYSNSVHAEELALSKAVAAGHRSFGRIAVSSERRDGVTPCGMCRQSLAEFCEDDFRVICEGQGADEGVGEPAVYTLGELLPNTITPEHLL